MLKFDWNMLWTLINLIVFFVLMRVFLFKPIKKTIDKRKELIEKQFKDAQDADDEANKLKEQYQAQLQEVEVEKKEIVSKARDDAKAEYNKILDRAQNDAEKIKADAKKAAEFEAQMARKSVNEELAALAMETAEKVIGKNINAQTDSELYDEFLNESSDK